MSLSLRLKRKWPSWVLFSLLTTSYLHGQDWENLIPDQGPWMAVIGIEEVTYQNVAYQNNGGANNVLVMRADFPDGIRNKKGYNLENITVYNETSSYIDHLIEYTEDDRLSDMIFYECQNSVNLVDTELGYSTSTPYSIIARISKDGSFAANLSNVGGGSAHPSLASVEERFNKNFFITKLTNFLNDQNNNFDMPTTQNGIVPSGECQGQEHPIISADKDRKARVLAIFTGEGCRTNFAYDNAGNASPVGTCLANSTCGTPKSSNNCLRYRFTATGEWNVRCVDSPVEVNPIVEVTDYPGEGWRSRIVGRYLPSTSSLNPREVYLSPPSDKAPQIEIGTTGLFGCSSGNWKSLPYGYRYSNDPENPPLRRYIGGCRAERSEGQNPAITVKCQPCVTGGGFVLRTGTVIGGAIISTAAAAATGTIVTVGNAFSQMFTQEDLPPWSPLIVGGGLAIGTGKALFTSLNDGIGSWCDESTIASLQTISSISEQEITLNSKRSNSSPDENRNQLSSKVRIYPNPASSQITIDFELLTDEIVTIHIANQLGEQVVHKGLFGSYQTGNNSITLAVDNLVKGIYFMQIDLGSQGVHTERIVKL